jgi:hypothetical protein
MKLIAERPFTPREREDMPWFVAVIGMLKWSMAVCELVNAGLALIVSSSNLAAAAEIKSLNSLKNGGVEISISGDIKPGDADVLKARIKAANDAGQLVTSLRLNSDGGNLLEGVLLAAVVRFAKMSTNVGRGETCASACFLIFAAGEEKYANYSARIGVHAASDIAVHSSRDATATMASVAKELGVPSSIIGRMVATPPGTVVWLSSADLQSMDVRRP